MEAQELPLNSGKHKRCWGGMLTMPSGELSPFKLNKCCQNEAHSSLWADKKLSIDLMSSL